eukprot:4284877-Prymnesium_polylepis.2
MPSITAMPVLQRHPLQHTGSLSWRGGSFTCSDPSSLVPIGPARGLPFAAALLPPTPPANASHH